MLADLEALEAIVAAAEAEPTTQPVAAPLPKRGPLPGTPPKRASPAAPELEPEAQAQRVEQVNMSADPPPWRVKPSGQLRIPSLKYGGPPPPPPPPPPSSRDSVANAGESSTAGEKKVSMWRPRPGHVDGGRWGSRGEHGNTWWFVAKEKARKQGPEALNAFYSLFGKAKGQGFYADGGVNSSSAKAPVPTPLPPPPPPPPKQRAQQQNEEAETRHAQPLSQAAWEELELELAMSW